VVAFLPENENTSDKSYGFNDFLPQKMGKKHFEKQLYKPFL